MEKDVQSTTVSPASLLCSDLLICTSGCVFQFPVCKYAEDIYSIRVDPAGSPPMESVPCEWALIRFKLQIYVL